MTAAAISTAMSKATGLPICGAIALVFAITLARKPADGTPRTTTVLRYAVVFLVALLSSFTIVAPKVGTYWEHYLRYGSPFVTNRYPEPFPRLFEHTTFTGDPGVRSIAESLFTFRIISLLRDPIVLNQRTDDYPLHRTSLWSQSLRANELHSVRRLLGIVAAALSLGDEHRAVDLHRRLFPAALLVLGVCGAMARMVSGAVRMRPQQWLIAISAAGYTAFLIALALRYRDYSFFKPIHAFAGLLAFLALFG